MQSDRQIIEQIPDHVPLVIWKNNDCTKQRGLEDPIAISVLFELEKFSYLETSIETIAHAFNKPPNKIRLILTELFEEGCFKQITIYHQGKASQLMFDKKDKNPHYTPTELRVLQKVQPKWEKK